MRRLIVTAVMAGFTASLAASVQEAQTLLDRGEWRAAAEMAASLNSSDGFTLAAKATTLGAGVSAETTREGMFERAEAYAKKAIELNPNNADAYFEMARADGRLAQYKGILQSLGIAGEVRNALNKAVTLDPKLAGAYVALGLWHAELASRGLIATAATGAKASEAQPNFEKAIALEPNVVTHRYEYANGLLKLADGNRRQAKAYRTAAIGVLERAVAMPARTFWEQRDLEAAKKLLADLKK